MCGDNPGAHAWCLWSPDMWHDGDRPKYLRAHEDYDARWIWNRSHGENPALNFSWGVPEDCRFFSVFAKIRTRLQPDNINSTNYRDFHVPPIGPGIGPGA